MTEKCVWNIVWEKVELRSLEHIVVPATPRCPECSGLDEECTSYISGTSYGIDIKTPNFELDGGRSLDYEEYKG